MKPAILESAKWSAHLLHLAVTLTAADEISEFDMASLRWRAVQVMSAANQLIVAIDAEKKPSR